VIITKCKQQDEYNTKENKRKRGKRGWPIFMCIKAKSNKAFPEMMSIDAIVDSGLFPKVGKIALYKMVREKLPFVKEGNRFLVHRRNVTLHALGVDVKRLYARINEEIDHGDPEKALDLLEQLQGQSEEASFEPTHEESDG
jgi:hypothetical protein